MEQKNQIKEIIKGIDFNRENSSQLIKLTTQDEIQYGHKFIDGINADSTLLTFSSFTPGGFNFIKIEYFMLWLLVSWRNPFIWYREVEIPDEADVIIKQCSFKSNIIILKERKKIDHVILKNIIKKFKQKEQIDIALWYGCLINDINIINTMIKTKYVNINIGLLYAYYGNHENIIKYMIPNSDVDALEKIMYLAKKDNHSKLYKIIERELYNKLKRKEFGKVNLDILLYRIKKRKNYELYEIISNEIERRLKNN